MAIEMPPAFLKLIGNSEVVSIILRGHNIRRLIRIAFLLGGQVKLCEDKKISLIAATRLHDIGKIFIPSHIVNKEGPLTSAEKERMKEHAAHGAAILIKLGFPEQVIEAVWSHHENWDGSGYPRGLRKDEIPELGRIIRVADSYDAMMTARPYKLVPLTPARALRRLQAGSGKQFDPELVDLLPNILAVH